MTHREQFEAMLREARIEFTPTGGDTIAIDDSRFRFDIHGNLTAHDHEGPDAESIEESAYERGEEEGYRAAIKDVKRALEDLE